MKAGILTAALCISTTIFGQFNWGLRTGFHLSNLGQADIRESGYALNAHTGLVADWSIKGSPFYIQGQLLYKPMGYKNSNIPGASDGGGLAAGNISRHRINYVEIPLYFLYGAKTGNMTIKAGLGPFFSVKTGDRLTLDGGEKFGNETMLPVYTKKITPLLTGLTIQASAEWSKLVLSLQFQQSMNDVYQNNASTGTRWRLNAFGLSAGFYF